MPQTLIKFQRNPILRVIIGENEITLNDKIHFERPLFATKLICAVLNGISKVLIGAYETNNIIIHFPVEDSYNLKLCKALEN